MDKEKIVSQETRKQQVQVCGDLGMGRVPRCQGTGQVLEQHESRRGTVGWVVEGMCGVCSLNLILIC